MYEITIRVREAGDASELVSLIVRSTTYDHVQGVRVARVGQQRAGLSSDGFEAERAAHRWPRDCPRDERRA